MKILMLGWELPPHNSGGLGVACYNMAKALSKVGAEIDFVVPYTADHSDIDFMTIHNATELGPLDRCGMGAYDSRAIGTKVFSKKEIKELQTISDVQEKYVHFVEQLVTTLHPDIIHVHDWLTMEAGIRAKQLTGAPLVVHVHATEFDRAGGNSGNPLVHDIEYQGLMMADRICAVSGITKNIIVQKYGIPASKIEVVHNAIDDSEFDDGYQYDWDTFKYLESLKKAGYTVVSTVTRFTIQKGLTYFLHAAAKAVRKYDKLVFLLVGDGEQRDELIKLASDLGIADRIFFTGFIRGSRWRDAFSVTDIFVMSSVSEPFGLTALEAAYHNNAIIITKQSGVGEVLDSAFRYDFWDEDALADKIVGIASSKSLKDTMQHDIKTEYNKISWHDVAEKCMKIYKSLQKRGKKR